MATFALRKFRQPDALKAIEPAKLVAFLGRFGTYFLGRGITLPADGALDYEKLVAVLMSPDDDVPLDMVNALYFVHEMSGDEAMEKLLAAADAHQLNLDLVDEPTAADVAIAIWLAAPHLLEELHAEAFVLKARNFEYFSGAARRKRQFPEWRKDDLVLIAAQLDSWFLEKRKGVGSRVFVFPHGTKVHILIKHGTTMRREGSIRDGTSAAEYFRPELHDTLVYDCTMDVLGVHAGSKSEKILYREVIGDVLFDDPDYFAKPFSLSLNPLRERGPEVVVCDDVPGMASVALVEIQRFLGGTYKERQTRKATDLLKVFGDEWAKRLGNGLVGATFEVTIGEGRTKRRRKVSLTPPNFAKFDRDDDDADIIELWLRRRQFMPEPKEDGFDAAPSATLADAGGATAESDGPTGVAAAAG